MHVRPLNEKDLKSIKLQEAQQQEEAYIRMGGNVSHMVTDDSLVFKRDETILGCCGLYPFWRGRAYLWALVSRETLSHDFIMPTKYMLKWLEEQQKKDAYRRVETTVENGFIPGHRWVNMLKFNPEGVMKKYGADGKDHWIYARIV